MNKFRVMDEWGLDKKALENSFQNRMLEEVKRRGNPPEEINYTLLPERISDNENTIGNYIGREVKI